jgi:hypothetical protein
MWGLFLEYCELRMRCDNGVCCVLKQMHAKHHERNVATKQSFNVYRPVYFENALCIYTPHWPRCSFISDTNILLQS